MIAIPNGDRISLTKALTTLRLVLPEEGRTFALCTGCATMAVVSVQEERISFRLEVPGPAVKCEGLGEVTRYLDTRAS